MSDLSHWNFAVDFTGEQAAALAMGFDPAALNYVQSLCLPLYGRMEQSFNAAKQLKSDPEVFVSIDLQCFTTSKDPEDGATFSKWLQEKKESGFETQRFTRDEVCRWLSAVCIKSRYQFDLGSNISDGVEMPIAAKERSTLLKLVIGMAIDGYGYDVKAAKSPVPLQLADILATLGMSISDDTVRKYLTEAKQTVLPKNSPLS
jgi:hypothetical protein